MLIIPLTICFFDKQMDSVLEALSHNPWTEHVYMPLGEKPWYPHYEAIRQARQGGERREYKLKA